MKKGDDTQIGRHVPDEMNVQAVNHKPKIIKRKAGARI